MSANAAEARLDAFMAKYSPEIAALAYESLAKMRSLLPGAVEMVYDNYNALVIGFSPTERPSDATFSIALYPRWVTLFFLQGAGLPDPKKLLKGKGALVRHLVLESGADLDKPAVLGLMKAALKRSKAAFNPDHEGHLVIRSVSPRQRPRRPAD